MSAWSSLRPGAGERLPFAGGCLATGCLHTVVSLAIMVIGGGRFGGEGSLLVLPFWLFLGVAQWVYLAPFGLVLGRLRIVGARKGVWFGGLLVVLLNALYWAGMGVATIVYRQKAAEVQSFAAAHPITHRKLTGSVAAIDAKRIDVQMAENTVSVALQSTTTYLRDGGPKVRERVTRDAVRVGAAVVVEASSYAGGPLDADYVTLTPAEPAESPTPR